MYPRIKLRSEDSKSLRHKQSKVFQLLETSEIFEIHRKRKKRNSIIENDQLTIEKYLNLKIAEQNTLSYQILKNMWPLMQGHYSIHDLVLIAERAPIWSQITESMDSVFEEMIAKHAMIFDINWL